MKSVNNKDLTPVPRSYTYKSFGEIHSETGSLVQPFIFTGREYDPESGLYFYRARYYDPRAGRFLTKDPIGFAGGDVNLYRYVFNDPINWIDPLGLIMAILDPKINRGLLPIEWVIFRPFEAFWKMEVIHSPGAASFNLRDRCGAVDNFLTFWSFCQNRLCFSLENIYQKF